VANGSAYAAVMSRTAYRMILLVLGVLFIVVVLGAVLFGPTGGNDSYPPPVERVEPADGSLMFGQPQILLDLQAGYRAHLTIDDIAIPDDQVTWTEATGLHVFVPGPGKAIATWTPGFHVIVADWDRVRGLPDPGSLSWSFRVQ
jgi:hypothetical protein